MEWYWIVLIVIGSLLLLFFIFCLLASGYLVHLLSYPIRYTREHAYKTDKEDGDVIKGDEVLERKPFELAMRDGYVIHGDVSLNGDSKKFVIISHGYTWNREGSIKYALLFYRLGYSIIMYDHRSHGDNVHNDVTMGYKEGPDLAEIINWAKKTYGEDIYLGLHGESMGAATVLYVNKFTDKVDFVVADCPYSSLYDLFRFQIVEHHFPKFLLPLCSMFLKISHHYSFKDVSPKEVMSKCHVPLLLIHGAVDGFIPPNESQFIYDMRDKNDITTLYYCEGADHAKSLVTNKEKYFEVLQEFLTQIERK